MWKTTRLTTSHLIPWTHFNENLHHTPLLPLHQVSQVQPSFTSHCQTLPTGISSSSIRNSIILIVAKVARVVIAIKCDTVAQLLALLALQPHSKKVMGSIPAWGAVGAGGQVLPRPSVLRWAISWAFLCGVCMFSPCSQGVSSTKDPNRKNMQNNRTHVHP